MKWTIAFLWSLDALHLALIAHTVYFYTVTNFTDLLAIHDRTWSICLLGLVATTSDSIIRLYYARRVWIMSEQNCFLTLGSLTFTSVTFVSGWGFGIKLFSYNSISEYAKMAWVIYTYFSSAVVADLWIAITLCFFLGRNRTGFKATDTKVNALMIYVINTGLLTSLCAACSLVSLVTMPYNYIVFGFFFSISKLYFNALLATLNAREQLREGLTGTGSGPGAYQMPRIVRMGSPSNAKHATSFGTINVTSGSPTRNEFNLGEKENQALAVTVRTETNYHTDEVRMLPDRYTSVLPL